MTKTDFIKQIKEEYNMTVREFFTHQLKEHNLTVMQFLDMRDAWSALDAADQMELLQNIVS